MKRYVVVDFIKYKEQHGYITLDKEKEDRIEANNLKEASELLNMCDSPNAYVLDKTNGKHILSKV